MEVKKYKCNVTSYEIIYNFDQINSIAYFDKVNTDYKYPKAFFALLQHSIQNLMNLDCKYIHQYVSHEDYHLIAQLKTSFVMVNKFTDSVEIKSCIKDFIESFGVVMGIPNFID